MSILHAVPGTPVDVYANGEELIPDFQPGTLTDPLELPAGTYDLAIYPAGVGPGLDPAGRQGRRRQRPGRANATVVAHLTPRATPMLTPFVNDVSAIPAGQARVTVRHTAAAPAVDVRADGAVVSPGLTNPKRGDAHRSRRHGERRRGPGGHDTVALGPADLTLAEGATTIVYAWGSQAAGFQLAVQTISGGHSAPSGVPGGTAGLTDDGAAAARRGAVLAGLVAAGAGALRLARGRG